MMKFGLPIILLGGGGYNILNVTRGVGHMIQDYAVTIKLKGKFQKQKFIMIFMHLTIKFMQRWIRISLIKIHVKISIK